MRTSLRAVFVLRRTDAEDVFSKIAKSFRAASTSDNFTVGSTVNN